MIEYPTRQVQRGGDQKREHQRSNKVLIEVWEAPLQSGLHAAVYHGHDKHNHLKDEQAPPRPEATFPCIPEQICNWAQTELPVHGCPHDSRVPQAAQDAAAFWLDVVDSQLSVELVHLYSNPDVRYALTDAAQAVAHVEIDHGSTPSTGSVGQDHRREP